MGLSTIVDWDPIVFVLSSILSLLTATAGCHFCFSKSKRQEVPFFKKNVLLINGNITTLRYIQTLIVQ